MRVVELCFHEADGRAAEAAARGLAEAGLCVLRRPVSAGRAPAASPAARERVLLWSDAFAALPADHAAWDERHLRATVAVPVGPNWPRRASRAWIVAQPRSGGLAAAAFWKLAAWAVVQPIGTRAQRLAVQRATSRRLAGLAADAPAPRRRRSWRELLEVGDLAPIRGARDWERAVTPLAVAGALVLTAFASAMAVDVATRAEAWSAIAQTPAPVRE